VIPLAGAEEAVLEHVLRELTVTVTTSPRKGLEPTLQLVDRLAGHGYEVVPHLAARHVRDRAELAALVDRLRAARVTDVLVMAGDAPEPVGEFEGSLPLLRALSELGRPFAEVGVTGYPERTPHMSEEAAMGSLLDKEDDATYVVSQVCFDPALIERWVRAVRGRGSRLVVRVGLPGPVSRDRLLRISERIGVGDSIGLLRVRSEASFDPTPLVRALSARIEGVPGVDSLHVFTFNELAATERWRRAQLERLGAPLAAS
jgi:methylenetetrahydrofolate reductase (NADPH)